MIFVLGEAETVESCLLALALSFIIVEEPLGWRGA